LPYNDSGYRLKNQEKNRKKNFFLRKRGAKILPYNDSGYRLKNQEKNRKKTFF
jgi:hypothetical protein